MRIIDHRQRPPLAHFKTLHPARDGANGREPLQRHVERQAGYAQAGQRRQQVARIEAAEQRAFQHTAAPWRHDLQAHAVDIQLEPAADHPLRRVARLAGFALEPVGHGGNARRDAVEQRTPERVIGVDHGIAQAVAVEQLALGMRIGLDIAVIVEVITRQVGQHGNVEIDAAHPGLVHGMRGDLGDHAAGTLAVHVEQCLLDGQRVRGGVRADTQFVVQAVADRADDAAAAILAVQRLGDVVAAGGLAVRARHPDHEQAVRGMPVVTVGDQADQLAQTAHGNHRHRQQRGHLCQPGLTRGRLPGHRGSTQCHGLAGVVQSVGLAAGDRQEQVARLDLAAVQRQARDGHFPGDRGLGQALQQPAQGMLGDEFARGHHAGPPAAICSESGSGKSSGGTAISRSAPDMTLENTGAATCPP